MQLTLIAFADLWQRCSFVTHLGRDGAAQDLASHHARNGDDAHDAHLVQHRREGQHQAALHGLPGGFHACGSQG